MFLFARCVHAKGRATAGTIVLVALLGLLVGLALAWPRLMAPPPHLSQVPSPVNEIKQQQLSAEITAKVDRATREVRRQGKRSEISIGEAEANAYLNTVIAAWRNDFTGPVKPTGVSVAFAGDAVVADVAMNVDGRAMGVRLNLSPRLTADTIVLSIKAVTLGVIPVPTSTVKKILGDTFVQGLLPPWAAGKVAYDARQNAFVLQKSLFPVDISALSIEPSQMKVAVGPWSER